MRGDFANRELYLGDQVRNIYAEVLRRVQDATQSHFFQYYGLSIDPKTKQSVWNPLTAQQVRTEGQVMVWLDEALAEADAAALEVMDDVMGAWAEAGYTYGLWFLALAGLSTYRTPVPPRATFREMVLAAGFAGLSYQARLRAWEAQVKAQTAKFLRTAIVGGWRLNDTLPLLTRGFSQTIAAIEQLVTHELHRAGIVGQLEAQRRHQGRLLGRVWLTREDPFVCPLCASLHMTITTKVPGDDSHPRCRCWLVPILLNADWQPVDYVGFLQSLGKR